MTKSGSRSSRQRDSLLNDYDDRGPERFIYEQD
jgi:hypothetical protein